MNRQFAQKLDGKLDEILWTARMLAVTQQIGGLDISEAFLEDDIWLRDIRDATFHAPHNTEVSLKNWQQANLPMRINKYKELNAKVSFLLKDLTPEELSIDFSELSQLPIVIGGLLVHQSEPETERREEIFNDIIKDLKSFQAVITEQLEGDMLELKALVKPIEGLRDYRLRPGITATNLFYLIQILLETVLIESDVYPVRSKAADIVASYFRPMNKEKVSAKSFLKCKWDDAAISSTYDLVEQLNSTISDKASELKSIQKKK